MSEVKVIIINGNGGVGKDAFINCCREHSDHIYNISTVDFVKEIATECGWDGTKTPKNRKFLSDLKDLLEEWDDVPNKEIGRYINNLSTMAKYCNYPTYVFIHAREPHNIQYYKDKYNAITVLVTNPRIEQVTSNHADMEVYDFTYDYIIDNNGDLEQLKKSSETFMNNAGIVVLNTTF